MPHVLTRHTLTLGASLAAATLLFTVLPAAAFADDGTATLQGTVSHVTATGDNEPSVTLYTLTGKPVGGGYPGSSGAYSITDVPAGVYKVGLGFDTRNLTGRNASYGKNDVSYFYAASGPTAVWSKASTVTLTSGSTSTLNLQAIAGVRISGTIKGEWINGPQLFFSPTAAAPGSAKGNSGSQIAATGKYIQSKSKDGQTVLKFTFMSAGLLPGKYNVWTNTLHGKHETVYFAGSTKSAVAKASRASVVVVKKKTVKIGTFLAK